MASRTQWAAAAVVLAAVACGAPCREAVAKEEASKSTAKPAKSIDEQITFSNAIENGRIPEVEALLAQGFSVNDAQAYGFNAGDSPLMKAAQQGNAQLVAFLLRRGARVGYRSPRDGETALFRAAKFAGGGGTTDRYTIDYRRALALLLQAGAAPNVPNHNRSLPLYFAREDWVIAALLAGGANPNAPTDRPPLIEHAAHPERVRRLLAAGARADVRDVHGTSPLDVAAGAGQLASVQPLVAAIKAGKGAAAARAVMGGSALRSAAAGGNPQVVALLLAQGLPPDVDMLHLAVSGGHLAAARQLQQALGLPSVPNPLPDGPARAQVYALILQQHPAQALAAYRAFEAKACGRKTPLMDAVDAGNEEAVRALLTLGVDVNYQPPAPLRSYQVPMPHTSSGLPRTVHVLPPPCDAPEPAPTAVTGGLTQGVQIAAGAAPSPPLQWAQDMAGALSPLSMRWAGEGGPALMRAVDRDNLAMASLLIAAGADPQLRSHYPPYASAQSRLLERYQYRGTVPAAWQTLFNIQPPGR